MPVVIYTFEQTPVEVVDRGQWLSPVDGKCVGWINDIPEGLNNLVIISKQQFIDRVKYIHSQQPYTKNTGEDIFEEVVEYTEEEILNYAGKWYDNYVSLYDGKNINYGLSE